MKRFIRSFTAFTRTERMGIIALTILLIMLIVIWQTMEYWIPAPEQDAAEQQKLARAYQLFKSNNLTSADPEKKFQEKVSTGEIKLFSFDPNTLDSTGFLRLGLSVKQIKGLMNWRRHGKTFHRKEDLKPLYNLTPSDYARLEPYIVINTALREPGRFKNSYPASSPLPATLDLNTTDVATLVRLNGIGTVLAQKIIERRKLLGGYLKHEQLTEVYKFSDSTFTMLQQKLVIRPEAVTKISINTATTEELQAHPYIGEKIAKNIVLYRNALKHFDNIQQIRQVPLMNEEIYRKIAPYLVIE